MSVCVRVYVCKCVYQCVCVRVYVCKCVYQCVCVHKTHNRSTVLRSINISGSQKRQKYKKEWFCEKEKDCCGSNCRRS